MLRCGYSTTARPFRDSDVEVGIRWYKCVPGAPTLGWESNINSLDWTCMPWLRTGKGEVFNAPREYHQQPPVPGALGQHVCGTEEDFRDGEKYLPDLPPVVYSPEGLPTCCGTVGGVVLGGTGVVPQITGGVVVGGERGVSPLFTDFCNLAVEFPSDLGVTYWTYVNPYPGNMFKFIGYDLPAGTYQVTCSAATGRGLPPQLWIRMTFDCIVFTGDLFFGAVPSAPFNIVVPTPSQVVVRFAQNDPLAFYLQFRLD